MILHGKALDRLRELPDHSFDSCVTDPPYGLSKPPDMREVLGHWLAGDDYVHQGGGFMGSSWDSFVPGPAVWTEVLRVLKPGGYLLAFGGSRTYDLLVTAIRLAGFEVRDTITWLYGQGFPKSRDISKALDERAGAEREVVGSKAGQPGYSLAQGEDNSVTYGYFGNPEGECAITAPSTPEAIRWAGWGTALKPGYEPIVVARAPFRGPVELNVVKHGTGAINVDANRIAVPGGSPSQQRRTSSPPSEVADRRAGEGRAIVNRSSDEAYQRERPGEAAGRFPPNVLLTHSPDCHPAGTREVKTGTYVGRNRDGEDKPGQVYAGNWRAQTEDMSHGIDGRETIEAWECAPGCPVALLDAQAGDLRSGAESKGGHQRNSDKFRTAYNGFTGTRREEGTLYGDTGSASRFYPATAWDADELVTAARMLYAAKASTAERVAGLAGGPETEGYVTGLRGFSTVRRCPDHDTSIPSGSNAYSCGCPVLYDGDDERVTLNPHPTVKPIDLMRWLVRLVTPPGGRGLDPFSGSGTTLCAAEVEGFEGWVGIDEDEDFVDLAERRLAFWREAPTGMATARVVEGDRKRSKVADSGQGSLI